MKLTSNFSKSEFDSKDGSEMPPNILDNVKKLAWYLQVIRDFVGVPIKVNSGYRSPNHNKSVGGSKGSKHMEGIAADLNPQGITTKQLYDSIEELTARGDLPEGGMKAYSTFVHWDYRGVRARW